MSSRSTASLASSFPPSVPGSPSCRSEDDIEGLAARTGALSTVARWPPAWASSPSWPPRPGRAHFASTPFLHASPQPTLRENLRPGQAYILAGHAAGFTNQLLGFLRLVTLAKRLDRTAILADMPPIHGEGSTARLSYFFDLDRLSSLTNISIAELSDAKTKDSTLANVESLSCWGPVGHHHPLHADHSIKTDFWPFPANLGHGHTTTFQAIEIIQAEDQTPWLEAHAQTAYPDSKARPPFPTPAVFCLHNTYYVQDYLFQNGRSLPGSLLLEGLPSHGPEWAQVGQHLHFTADVEDVVDAFLLSAAGVNLERFVTVHIRQGDFISGGRALNGSQELVDVYLRGVRQVQDVLRARHIIKRDLPVIFATDSRNEHFLELLANIGWTYLNHTRFNTVERYGGWYPGLLDSAVLSRGTGFVGTERSTFSYLAQRRVETWNGGYGLTVSARPA
ncbi:uncharacterized protein JCM10292_007075 [Rhodotorula paludigena]|uniref:uncharacterized protein n=1 Tax=Rhodotorula paludigena TaxID=86838 RepID=UPI00317ADAF7